MRDFRQGHYLKPDIAGAFRTLKNEMNDDTKLAWEWHRNLVDAFCDAMADNEVNKHKAINDGAAIFMERCFGVKVEEYAPHQFLDDDLNLLVEDVAATITNDRIKKTRQAEERVRRFERNKGAFY
jgi:hypothetical protein